MLRQLVQVYIEDHLPADHLRVLKVAEQSERSAFLNLVTSLGNQPERPDHDLKAQLRAELPAILRWCIDGCLAWQFDRLGSCKAVEAETGTYFEQQDHFGRWLSERCNVVPSMSERPSKLLADFLVWAKESGEAAVTSSEFRELVERTPTLRYATVKGLQWVKGVGLKPAEGTSGRRDHPYDQ